MADIFLHLVFGVFKAVTLVYNIVTFVPYYVVCQPGEKLKRSNRLKAKRIEESPDSPYRAVDVALKELTTTPFPECRTLDDLFIRAVRIYGGKKCLGTREVLREEDEKQPNGKVFKKVILGEYNWISFEEVFTRITNLGSGLLALGQKPRCNTLIYAETRAEWMIAAQACFKYNFPVVTLYATLGVDALVHGINESEVSYVITSAELLPKFQGILDQIPKVSHLIVMCDEQKISKKDFPSHINILTFAEVELIGAEPDNIRTPVTKPSRDDTAVIMYTSGSTGKPKGVIISHGNLMSGMSGQCQRIEGLGPHDTYIGYLPLAHVLELSAETASLSHGVAIGYSSPLTLTDQSSKIKKGSQGDISVLKPTLMAAVPVIMDRLYKGVWDKVKSGSPFSRALFQFAYEYKKNSLEKGYDTPVFNKILFSKIRQLLGGELRMMLSGGAPLSEKTQRFMNICFCCPVLQGYGLTETCGAGTVCDVNDMSTGRVGPPVTCCEIRLRNWQEGNYLNTNKPYPQGEILIGGGNVVQGYYKNKEKTEEDFTVIDGLQYFCTGDIGQVEKDGSLRVIDRMKDLVKLQHGEYISLSRIETALKMCPLVEQICIHANSSQSVCIALIVPSQKNLTELAKKIGITGKEIEDLCEDEKVEKEVLKELATAGRKAKLEKFEIPSKLKLCPEPWMPDTGLVTDAFKLKRKNIEETFKPSLQRMYSFA
ncbi:long-chain-fatty-acid--CoA ligase 4-like [Mercenaria mercenaria]|uniref:long-chain-fatty-acid--CoA ligase 4-like n=1 Tax=Mercenaria mercenaria TaxID=6596 RepID=UPI00234F75B0|nr:long-chain-fatty-acid--CoA ligase 4-like [Mercenaria mercenaria]